MLAMEVTEPAQTELSARIAFVPKKEGLLRFFFDYGKLNSVTSRNSYQIPHMDGFLDSLGYATIFSALVADSRYLNIGRAEKHRDKTAFT